MASSIGMALVHAGMPMGRRVHPCLRAFTPAVLGVIGFIRFRLVGGDYVSAAWHPF